MKKYRFLLFFLIVLSISVLDSCGGASQKETSKDTTQVSGDTVAPEEKADSLVK